MDWSAFSGPLLDQLKRLLVRSRKRDSPENDYAHCAPEPGRIGLVEVLGAAWPHIPFGAPKGCPQERLVLIDDSRIDWRRRASGVPAGQVYPP
jgi:hypothetical protein